jgi:hypothetical protein
LPSFPSGYDTTADCRKGRETGFGAQSLAAPGDVYPACPTGSGRTRKNPENPKAYEFFSVAPTMPGFLTVEFLAARRLLQSSDSARVSTEQTDKSRREQM